MKKILAGILLLTTILFTVSCGSSNKLYFKEGIYTATVNDKVSLVYVFYGNEEGGSRYFLDGNGVPFAYEVKELNKNGDTIIFHIGDAFDNTEVKVKKKNENNMTITLSNNSVHKLEFVEKNVEKLDKVLSKYNTSE